MNSSRAKSVRRFFAAAPAVLAIVVIGVIAISMHRAAPVTPAWYQLAADDAFDSGDYRTAAVCYERLLQSHPKDRATALNLAQSLDAIGQRDSAESLRARFRE